ncbi:hypothetical protein CDAR_287561 [Caerostris darwini]|uniref:Secreted protein n=1 Tax=Caerostris darwini TaxID=1538125 RepID=A0AAV4NDH3_9ARAC|nr:hypothetical protein CDAR_287561 [Caerostris darwini]
MLSSGLSLLTYSVSIYGQRNLSYTSAVVYYAGFSKTFCATRDARQMKEMNLFVCFLLLFFGRRSRAVQNSSGFRVPGGVMDARWPGGKQQPSRERHARW